MNSARDPLEETLARLNSPPPPSDLAARCLATVPARTLEQRPLTWFTKGATMKRLAFAAAVLAAVAFWTTRPVVHEIGVNRAAMSAFAQTIKVMQRVSYYQMTMRAPLSPMLDEKVWTSPQTPLPIKSLERFDAERGLYREFRASEPNDAGAEKTYVARTLDLPSDVKVEVREYDDGSAGKGVRRTEETGRWNRERQEAIRTVSQPLVNWLAICDFVGSEQQRRNGRRVTVYTLRGREKPLVADVSYFVVVTDNATKRLVLLRWLLEKGGTRRTVTEWECDYTRPDPACFDPDRLAQDANEVQKQDGGPGVIFSSE